MTLLTSNSPDTHNEVCYLTATVVDQVFGIPIPLLRDVIEVSMPITPIPLSTPQIAGILNLRGHLVTALYLERYLGLQSPSDHPARFAIVFEKDSELYGMLVHDIGDVLTLPNTALQPLPMLQDTIWTTLAHGLIQHDNRIIVILDPHKLLTSERYSHDDILPSC